MQGNQLEAARDVYAKVVSISPEDVEAWHTLSSINGKLGRIDEAESCSRRVIALQDDYADAYVNLGHVYSQRGNYHEALSHYQTAVRLKPDSPVAYFNMGIIFNAQGKQDAAIEAYRQAVQLSPLYTDAHNNLGTVYLERGDFNEAVFCYVKALEINPLYVIALNNLAKTCQSPEQIDRYFEFYRQAITRLADPTEARRVFIGVAVRMHLSTYEPWLDVELQQCLQASDVDLRPLALVTAQLLKYKYAIPEHAILDDEWVWDIIAHIGADDLFLLFSEKVVNIDPDIEALLTKVRRILLFKAGQINDITEQGLRLVSALAFQCFNNEYIFAVDAEEVQRLADLKQGIEQHVSGNLSPDQDFECMLFTVGMYENLFSLSCSERLAGYPITTWSERFRLYAEYSLFNYFKEQKIKEGIESLGSISDQTSQLVQSQYEHNPYPRWLSLSNKRIEKDAKQFFKTLFPDFNPPQFLEGPIKVLIAGCGTGKQAIHASMSYSNAEILAVDISKSSLAYAVRMAEKYNIKNIQFKQADILELSQLNTRFHIIECQGVLHHMEDPLKGWRVLSELLVNDGLMSIGLYSEKARKDVVAARKIIKAEHLSADENTIRNFRSRIFRHEIPDLIYAFGNSYDFYTMSACRDLLFHFKEHRFSLPQINSILDELKLDFLGFMFTDTRVMSMYREQFPEDKSMANLLLWDRFETMHPSTFFGMYQFFAKKFK